MYKVSYYLSGLNESCLFTGGWTENKENVFELQWNELYKISIISDLNESCLYIVQRVEMLWTRMTGHLTARHDPNFILLIMSSSWGQDFGQ